MVTVFRSLHAFGCKVLPPDVKFRYLDVITNCIKFHIALLKHTEKANRGCYTMTAACASPGRYKGHILTAHCAPSCLGS